MVTDALSLNLGQIGERAAVGKLSNELKEKYKELIKWHELNGFRNRTYHNYLEVNTKIVIDTAVSDIPVLIGNLEMIRDDLLQEMNN